MEQTYMMIKPEVVAAGDQKIGAILELVNRSGFRIIDLKMLELERSTAEKFYDVHQDRPFFPELVEYITSGPVIGIRLERESAVLKLRELVGATNPVESAAGTIRFLYGTSLQANAVHASDSVENGLREIGIIFGN